MKICYVGAEFYVDGWTGRMKLMVSFHNFANMPKKNYTGCPTRYRTQHFFNNSNTTADIATKFERGYVRCVRNEEECVCNVCL
jgi:hypothetical protein